jgi:hypothetical protein
VTILKDRSYLLSLVFFIILVPLAYAEEISPRGVVLQWTKIYGVDYYQAADLTTLEFRKGKSKEEWADQIGEILGSVKYKHLGGKVIEETISGDNAAVVLDARIYTIVGSAKQKEIYELKKIDGIWLINNIAVKEEEIEDDPRGSGKDL